MSKAKAGSVRKLTAPKPTSAAASLTASLTVNGWTVFAHPLFLDQLEALQQQVEALKQNDAAGYIQKNASKRLAAIAKLAFAVIAQDPARAEYRQGSTLGDEHKHWFCAPFFQQYRLFFRYHAPSKVIVLAWVNGDDSLRPPLGSPLGSPPVSKQLPVTGPAATPWR